jgi:hypothetical protein
MKSQDIPTQEQKDATITDMLATLASQGQAIRDLQQGLPVRAVQMLRPQAGDVILLTLPDNASEASRRQLGRSFHGAVGPKVKVAVLPHTISVRVVRVEDIPPDAFCDHTPVIQPGQSSML